MPTSSSSEPKTEPARTLYVFRLIHLRVPAQKRDSIYDSIKAGTHANLEYQALVALAALIALFGLLQNSAAVIIGAMLISPMITPLLAGALALLLGDGKLGRQALLVLIGSVIASIALTWLVAFLVPLNQATPEILARTTPNLLDLFIAFLSGLAGALALRGGPSSLMIIPGVAIAVAVVPPLAVVGYGLSAGHMSIAGGAFLLFLTNMVAIVISAALVFRSMGFRPQRAAEAGPWKLKYRMAISAGVLFLLSIPLFLTLRRAVSQLRLRADVNSQLQFEFQADHASLSDMSLAFARQRLQVHATVRTTKYLDPLQIAAIEKSLQDRFGPGTHLEVDQILVAVGGVSTPPPAPSQNALTGGVIRPVEQAPAFDFKTSEASLIAHLQTQLDELLTGASIHRVAPLRLQLTAAPSVLVTADLTAAEPVPPQTIALLATQLSSKVSVPVQLNGTVEFSGAEYNYSFEAVPSARVLRAAQRRALDKLIQVIRRTRSLRLQVIYRLPPKVSPDHKPPLLAQLTGVLTRAGLKPSQWSITQTPAAGGPAPSAATTSAQSAPSSTEAPPSVQAPPSTQVHYEFRIVQIF